MKQRVRAVLVRDGQLCLIHRVKADREYWVFPGGGVDETDASLEEALARECREELGYEITVGQEFAQDTIPGKEGEQVEIFYLCDLVREIGAAMTGPEGQRDPKTSGTYEVQWVPIAEATGINVQPTAVRDQLAQLLEQ